MNNLAAHLVAPSPTTDIAPPHTIRQATVLDVPAMVRALPLAVAPEGVSADDMSRVLRLTLTHIAIEHGAAWIAVSEDAEVLASVIAVPSWETSDSSELQDLLARETDLEQAGDVPVPDMVARLGAIGRAWIIAHPVAGDSAGTERLLEVASEWASEQAAADGVPVVMIAPHPEDRPQAERLGFTSLDLQGLDESVWIGIKE